MKIAAILMLSFFVTSAFAHSSHMDEFDAPPIPKSAPKKVPAKDKKKHPAKNDANKPSATPAEMKVEEKADKAR